MLAIVYDYKYCINHASELWLWSSLDLLACCDAVTVKRDFRDFIEYNILPVLVLDYIISVQVPIEKLLLYIHMTKRPNNSTGFQGRRWIKQDVCLFV